MALTHLARGAVSVCSVRKSLLSGARGASIWAPGVNDGFRLGWGAAAHLLVGSRQFRALGRGLALAMTHAALAMTHAHLVDGLGRVRCRIALTRTWRLDRMATVCHPDAGR
ncbi:hypothetical protein FXW78_22575 [Rhodococcus opacus]|nr:hypothetical protein [Rhodococcus opacus]